MIKKKYFHKYNLYALEQITEEEFFIELLDSIPALNEAIKPFTSQVSSYLYLLIKQGDTIDVNKIKLPNIDDDLELGLEKNLLFKKFKATCKENLSELALSKFLNRLFKRDGLNNEKYIIVKNVQLWLEQKLALEIIKDSRFNSIKILNKLISTTHYCHRFYYFLVINYPNHLIKDNWIDVDVSDNNLIDFIRNDYKDFLKTKPQKNENLTKFLDKIKHFSDYGNLYGKYSFISTVLLKNNLQLYLKFWDNLEMPVIQDSALNDSGFTPNIVLNLIKEITSNDYKLKSNLKILLYILVRNYFEKSIRLTEKLSVYEDNSRKSQGNKKIFELGKKYYAEWIGEKEGNYKKIINLLRNKMSDSEIEEWIFSYKVFANNIRSLEIELLQKAYKQQHSNKLNLNDLDELNIEKLNFYIEINKTNKNLDVSLQLLDKTIDYIKSEYFYWDRTFNKSYWTLLKGISFLLSRQENPVDRAIELISDFKVNHQGWKPILIDYKPLNKESFIYCGIILMFEYNTVFDDDRQFEYFFKYNLKTVLVQSRNSLTDNSDIYELPLSLLFEVSNQFSIEIKSFFETELIEKYDDLYSLLKILSDKSKPITTNLKEKLSDRLDYELTIEKRKLKQKKLDRKVSNLEKMVNSIFNNPTSN